MKSSTRRIIVSLCLIVCWLAPVTVFAKKGEKNFREGVKYEAAQQWDRAAQEFTLAVAADPSNMEYQLHYRRALFNASQACVQQGRSLAEQRDYVGAYNAFRRAYAYDPVNKLAANEMERMLELQSESKRAGGACGATATVEEERVDITAASYRKDLPERAESAGRPSGDGRTGQEAAAPASAQKLRVIAYNGDLEGLINSLADELNLNIIYDTQTFKQPRSIRIHLRDVTAARALDLIFLKEGLFFQKVDRRTVFVADQARRVQYQQLMLRTFYLSNIDPQEAQKHVLAMIPPSQGRPQSVVTAEKSTNSLTVRDTAENLHLIGELLKSIDKDRSEVVMDVQIYEVTASDLMQIGNQLGSQSSLGNLGGASSLSITGGSREVAQQIFSAPTALGAALVLPSSTLSMLQKKNRTRVLASTQIHAFDGEKSEVHIGQRVPVQTAQVYSSVPTSGTSSGVASGVYGSTGYPVISYEPTGLTLEFTPQVYPNLDVQVKMSIKSNDVANSSTLTPTFTERNLSGTARIQNNQTMMVASVSQDQQSRGRTGLPLLGLVPLLGRLFTAPTNEGKQTDIVVAVTPRVLRAPAVTPRDEEMWRTGTLQSPLTESLEAVIAEAEREEQFAAARRLPSEVNVQVPAAETPEFVPASKPLLGEAVGRSQQMPEAMLVKALKPVGGSSPSTSTLGDALGALAAANPRMLALNEGAAIENVYGDSARSQGTYDLLPVAEKSELKAGERIGVKLMLRAAVPIRAAIIKLKYDPSVMTVENISPGDLFDKAVAMPQITQSAEAGELFLTISGPTIGGSGALLMLTIKTTAKGVAFITLEKSAVHLIGADGRELSAQELGQARLIAQ